MRDEHPVEYYMYKPITENPIVIDFSKVRYYDELYELLKDTECLDLAPLKAAAGV